MTYLENAWYCAAFGGEVGETPIARRLLDRPVLLTRDAAGAVRAIGDMCPHRFAPLHQGQRFGDVIECPYHGLRFGLDGRCVLNPHGSGKIPPAAAVPVYPVIERAGVVWLWPGDAALADPDQILPLDMFEHGEPVPSGYLTMPVDYRLVIDNLLDLSHAAYIHQGTLAPPRARRESHFDVDDRSVRAHYLMRDVETPANQRIVYNGARGDYYSDMEWNAPGTLRQQLAMTETGAPREAGGLMHGAHLITPETAGSTHYFWLASRNRNAGNAAIDARLKEMVTFAFTTQDEPMIAACQANMRGREFFSLQPLYLETDYAGTRARRILEKLIVEEQAERRAKTARIVEAAA